MGGTRQVCSILVIVTSQQWCPGDAVLSMACVQAHMTAEHIYRVLARHAVCVSAPKDS